MFISDDTRYILRHAICHLSFAILCAVFGAVYEHFSFGVYSYCMIYSFAAPLVIGFILLHVALSGRKVPLLFLQLIGAASATLSIGCITTGIIEIYGTTNHLLYAYPVAGVILLLFSIITLHKSSKSDEEDEPSDGQH